MTPLPFIALLIAMPIFIYAVKNDSRKDEYWHIAKTIWKHRLDTYKRLNYGNYSITYTSRYSNHCFYIDIYLHKDRNMLGSINYVINADDEREKLNHDDIPFNELKKFKEIIDIMDKDPEWR